MSSHGCAVHRQLAAPAPPTGRLRFHHLAVQTADLDNCVSWYQDFFGVQAAWTLRTFSDLTRSRLPGITRLTELVIGDFRIHLVELPGSAGGGPPAHTTRFQHACLQVGSPDELQGWAQHWRDLFASGRYDFALAEQPTDIVRDEDGVDSFYALDVNGLEYEFTFIPAGGTR